MIETLILYGQPVADKIKQEILQNVESLKRKPRLAAVGFFSNLQWQQYVKSLIKSAEDYNCLVEPVNFDDGVSTADFETAIKQLNSDGGIDGILVQQPLSKDFKNAINLISPKKDIDGLTESNIHSIFLNSENFIPATPLAVLRMLEFYGISLAEKNVVILGRGTAVGKPLSLLMLNRNATPTVCHTKTLNIEKIAKSADILISACGQANWIDESFVNDQTILIDVGLSFVDGKTKGDVNFESVCGKVKAVSPVPKGIGLVTRACLFSNLLKTVQK